MNSRKMWISVSVRELLVVGLLFLSVNSFQAQTLRFTISAVENLELSSDQSKTVGGTINPSIPISIGYDFKSNENQSSWFINAGFNRFKHSTPSWKKTDFGRIHQNIGPYYSFGLSIGREISLSQDSRIYLRSAFGLSFYSGVKDSSKTIPNDTASRGYRTQVNGQTEELKFEAYYYGRVVSTLNLGLKFEIIRRMRPEKRIQFEYGVVYRVGLNPIYQVDFWFEDYLHQTSGSGIIQSRGSYLGFIVSTCINRKD